MAEPDNRARIMLSATLAVRLVGVVIVVLALPGVIAFLAWWAKRLSVNSMDYVWDYLIGRDWPDRLVELGPVVQAAIEGDSTA